jgi:hypothetical protein
MILSSPGENIYIKYDAGFTRPYPTSAELPKYAKDLLFRLETCSCDDHQKSAGKTKLHVTTAQEVLRYALAT